MLPRDFETLVEFPRCTAEQWRALVDADLNGASFEKKLVTTTYEGVSIRPLYTEGPAGLASDERSGRPGFARGGRVLNNALTGWDIRQERAESDAADVNKALLEDLAGGVGSVIIRLDAAGRAGMDADDARAPSLIGQDGVSLSSPGEWRRAFEGVHLNMILVGLEAGAAFVPASAQLAAMWQAAGIPDEAARGAFNADPLAVLARDGRLPYSLADGLRLAADLASWTDARFPRSTALRVGTAPYHHAGATATQDLGFSMATALEYLRAMEGAGLPIDRAARQMVFSYAVGCNFFLAIAKLRAARRLWGRVVEACGGAADARRMVMHVRASKRVLTARDPWVNLLRNTVSVFAAGVAGAEAIGSAPFDSALGPPSALARRLARNTPLILQEECHLHRISDPSGGSHYLETLTEELAEKAWGILQQIEAKGGMAACLTGGWVASQIESAFGPRAKNLATRRDAITGVSEFPDVGAEPPAREGRDMAQVRGEIRKRLETYRGKPVGRVGPIAVGGTPGSASAAAFAAAERGATIGKIHEAIAVGAHPATELAAPIAVHPFAEPFERLRDASDRYAAECGSRPRVFLASLGPIATHLARTNYARNFFEAGGFEVISDDGHAEPAAAAAAFAASGAGTAVICSSDALYERHAGDLAARLHAAGARTVVLAGHPGENEAVYRAAGIDRFIYVRCDVIRTLAELLEAEGVHA
ncbi:MAG: methylmalonyl-CoA mutase small subunit [Phycisphaerales bacterium]|nr:methylmalonyl-CoA mutase small subunit [Phycisphaerales bacterium]